MKHFNTVSKTRIALPAAGSLLEQQQKAAVTLSFATAIDGWIKTIGNFLGLVRDDA
jgi:hypothetical protein